MGPHGFFVVAVTPTAQCSGVFVAIRLVQAPEKRPSRKNVLFQNDKVPALLVLAKGYWKTEVALEDALVHLGTCEVFVGAFALRNADHSLGL